MLDNIGDEIERGEVHPESFALRTMAERLAQVGDLWPRMPGQSLAGPMQHIERLGGRLEVPIIRRFGNR